MEKKVQVKARSKVSLIRLGRNAGGVEASGITRENALRRERAKQQAKGESSEAKVEEARLEVRERPEERREVNQEGRAQEESLEARAQGKVQKEVVLHVEGHTTRLIVLRIRGEVEEEALIRLGPWLL